MIVIPLVGEFSGQWKKYQSSPYIRVEISLPLIGELLVYWSEWYYGFPYFLMCDHSWFRDLVAFWCGARKIDDAWELVSDLGYDFPTAEAMVHFCFLTGISCLGGRRF